MKNIERQKSLDKEKWLLSESEKQDMSGKMGYCRFCNSCNDGVCVASQCEREKGGLCAIAYNRADRKRRKQA